MPNDCGPRPALTSPALTTLMGTCTSNSGPADVEQAHANNQPTATTTTKTAPVGNEQDDQAAERAEQAALANNQGYTAREPTTSARLVAEYWACQQGTGHRDHANQKCPQCQSLNTAEYDGTRTSYDYCKDCKHEWNRWYD